MVVTAKAIMRLPHLPFAVGFPQLYRFFPLEPGPVQKVVGVRDGSELCEVTASTQECDDLDRFLAPLSVEEKHRLLPVLFRSGWEHTLLFPVSATTPHFCSGRGIQSNRGNSYTRYH